MMKIEAISIKNYGIKIKDKWYDVIGNARNYLDKINKGDDVDIKFDDNNKITYIKKKGDDILPILNRIEHKINEIEKRLSMLFEFQGGDENGREDKDNK